MVSKCANPRCSARMKFMHEGAVYIVRKHSTDEYWAGDAGSFGAPPGTQIECFWLCARCAREMKVSNDGEVEHLKVPALTGAIYENRL